MRILSVRQCVRMYRLFIGFRRNFLLKVYTKRFLINLILIRIGHLSLYNSQNIIRMIKSGG
jgi:hypothetical protein